MGLTLFMPDGWREFSAISAGFRGHLADQADMTSTLQKVIEAGNVSIQGVPYYGEWGEVDSESDLLLYDNTKL